MIKIPELRKKSKTELEKILKDNREKLRQLRFDLASGKIKNVREIRKIKKEIAQILTLLEELSTSEGGRGNHPVSPYRKTLKTEGF